MDVRDVRASAAAAPVLRVGASTSGADADAAFPLLAPFNQGGVYVGTWSGAGPWERHPEADELLYVLDGDLDVTLLSDDGEVLVSVPAGSIFVVPRGIWHLPVPRATVTLLSATPKPTEVSFEHPLGRK